MNISFVDELKGVVEEVSEWATELINSVSKALTEDSPPFGAKALTSQERLEQYMEVRGQAQVWTNYIDMRAQEIIQKLLNNGITLDKVASVHPYNIAILEAVQYSKEMEAMISGRSI